MSKDLLLEIGTEEIPAHAIPGILSQLGERAEKGLQELRVGFGEIRTLGTPRRLALIVKDLEERQQDKASESRGPSVQIAFDAEGNPTKAAEGFARGQGIAAKDLIQRDGYVYACVEEKGQDTAELLQGFLPNLICSLTFPNSMRWGDLDFRFIRPLRWIVAIYGTEVVPFELARVQSGMRSRGHRFLGDAEFVISSADSYEEECKEQSIIVDPEKRKQMIKAQISETAQANGGRAEITPDLLEEVLYLVEYPTALCGSFDEKYLKLPPEAVITPMRDHQRYFPVKDAAGRLLPLFITVRNGGRDHLSTVQRGNERVLRARLEDAQFFFDEDRKKSLEKHGEKLKTVVFQEGLGSVYEKADRLEKISERIAEMIDASAEEKKAALRAAKLCKADLVTGMVTEFTELQGIMGREYAKLDGEGEEVAIAIDEHYQPRFAGDDQPKTTAGRIVSLADKIDNIVGTFSRGKIPTGSQDPFALRRQALGMVHMLIEAKWSMDLPVLVDQSMQLYGIADKERKEKLQGEFEEFLRLRVKNVLSDMEIRHDIADAVFADAKDICGVPLRAKALTEFVSKTPKVELEAFGRVVNLAKKGQAGEIRSELFTLEAEKALGAAYDSVSERSVAILEAKDYAALLDLYAELSAPIHQFFEQVMVMDENEAIRNNRLALLVAIDSLLKKFADFGKLLV